MRVLVCVPIHIRNDAKHLRQACQSIISSDKRSSHSFSWYLDINNSDSEVYETFRSVLLNVPESDRFYIHNTSIKGRAPALNRALAHARLNGFERIVFLNDDVYPTTGSIEHLASSLDHREIVGGLSLPIDLRDSRLGVPDSHRAELAYTKKRNLGKLRFKGDFFAMRTDWLNEFPNIHSDGGFLDALHQHRMGCPIPVNSMAEVYRYTVSTDEEFVRRIQRHLEGKKQLKQYCASYNPELLPYVYHTVTVEGLDEQQRLLAEEKMTADEALNLRFLLLALNRINSCESRIEGSFWSRER